MLELTKGTKVKGRYILIEYKGSGSFGEVWLAHDDFLDIDVAIKIYISLDVKGIDEFKREYRTTQGISHPNLLTTTYLDVWQQRPFLIMRYCAKGSSSRLAGNTNEYVIWQFIHDVAAGLKFLHNLPEPIIHQDIKPDNILVDDNDRFVITDFGISKKLRYTMRKQSRRDVGAGTISYMGPERFDTDPTPVKASDIWALGASIYELATSEVPFSGLGGGMQRVSAEMPSLDVQWSKELNMVMRSCLEKETWDRPNAGQLEDYANDILEGRPAMATWEVKEVVIERGLTEHQNPDGISRPSELEEEIHWDEDHPDRLDFDYYGRLRVLANTVLLGGILFAILNIIEDLSLCYETEVDSVGAILFDTLLCVPAIICYRAILKRRPNALFLCRGYWITIMLLSILITASIVLDNDLSLLYIFSDIACLLWCIGGIIATYTSNEIKTVFPKYFRKTKAKDYLRVLAFSIIPFVLAIAVYTLFAIFEGIDEGIGADSQDIVPVTDAIATNVSDISEVESQENEAENKQEAPIPKVTETNTAKQESAMQEKSVDIKAQQLKEALASSDYKQVQRLANSGYTAAYGPLAIYYLKNNDYATAEFYAKKARSAGYDEGADVIQTLSDLGYYD